jgi:cell division protein FtsN
MEENNKVIIFEKKEIILILLFVLVLIITSFTIGIRLGKKLALNESGIKEEDVKTVQLKSDEEESVEETLSEDSQLTDDDKLKKLMDESKAQLSEELEKFSSNEASSEVSSKISNQASGDLSKDNSLIGKFTIQLGSYNTPEEARQFAEGFTVRGYSPILNEVRIEGKGTWYRICLGTFNNVDEAKDYIKKEQSLFAGQDHVITELK